VPVREGANDAPGRAPSEHAWRESRAIFLQAPSLYAATREAAMHAFERSWHGEK
jgi:hypothetical protein